MFDVGMFEMILIGVIALLILGPERMPEAARAAGRWVGKARTFITGIKADVESKMSLDELNELRQLRNDLSSAQTELSQIQNSVGSALNEQVPVQATAAESLKLGDSDDVEAIGETTEKQKTDKA